MDVKVSIAAIKDAITKSAAERTSPEVISAAYAVVHLIGGDRKSTRLNSSHTDSSRMPSSA